MTPFFSPGPLSTPIPKIVIAAVGEVMCEVAGDVCDGIFLHGFTTEKYVREVTLPAIQRGQEKSGRSMDDFEIYGLPLTATGPDEESMTAAIKGVRDQIAFYGSTPTYRKVLRCTAGAPWATTCTRCRAQMIPIAGRRWVTSSTTTS
ncbi:LLM class flavin-dependent oxidoreductase [Aeromicrobium sp. UC242_57]|uniref:LLM class flavin-dependent oxidoreductase n=1 Tax=Aeromicrobium sp. UC242_57 TaxID=3374624 RepID=UPI0037931E81